MTSLQEMQARAQADLDEAFPIDNAYTLEFRRLADAIVARVRTETLDACEAGMPKQIDTPTILSYKRLDEDAKVGLASMAGFNDACNQVSAHLRALREGETNK